MPTRTPIGRIVRLLTSAVMCAGLLTAVTPGQARAVTSKPVDVWQSVAVSLHDLEANKEPTLVITARARAGLKPPLEAALAIPKGVQVVWAGEILGGDPAKDPTLKIRVESGAKYDVAYFTLVNSPRVQFELTVPDGMVVRSDSSVGVDLRWTAAGALDHGAIAVWVPGDSHLADVVPVPSIARVAGAGFVYSAETSPVVAGQALTISGTMLPGAETNAAAAETADATASRTPTTTSPAASSSPAFGESSSTPGSEASGRSGFPWTAALIAIVALMAVAAIAVLLRRAGRA